MWKTEVLDFVELVLQMVVSCLIWMLGTEWVLWKSRTSLSPSLGMAYLHPMGKCGHPSLGLPFKVPKSPGQAYSQPDLAPEVELPSGWTLPGGSLPVLLD